MATWLITAALSTAIVGFVWLIVAACRGTRRSCGTSGVATSSDGGSWMYFGGSSDSSHSDGHHGHDSGGCDSGSDGGGSDGGGGDGGGGD